MKRPTSSRRKWIRVIAWLLLLVVLLTMVPVNRPMEISGFAVPAGADSVIIAAGIRYRANAIQRFLQGEHYRELWTLPIPVEVLHLASFDGGLTPTDEGGGMQTRKLHFVSGNGRRYGFRSIDKEPTRAFYPLFRRGIIAWMLQDQTSSSHPAGALVVAPLEEAVGLPPDRPRMVVLPDDSTLGSYRSRYGGVLGVLQERPGELTSTHPESAGHPQTRDTEELMARLDSVALDQVDGRGFLTARLLDFFLNDWDRHQGQWRWEARPAATGTEWTPIPVDRDQAFSWYDGFVMALARIRSPKLAEFGPKIPPLKGLTKNSMELDQRLLGGVSRGDWDSVAAFVRRRLTDSVIDEAVARMPEAYRQVSGAAMAAVLKERREQIPGLAAEFYRQTSHEAEAHAAADGAIIRVTNGPDGTLDLSIATGATGPAVWHRRYQPEETERVTLHLHGAADRIEVSGAAEGRIAVRVVDHTGRRLALPSPR